MIHILLSTRSLHFRQIQMLLITDFDGTLARQDFYQLVFAHLLPANVPNYWQDYLQKKLTHFEVLKSYFAEIRCNENEVNQLLQKMELEPELPSLLQQLHEQGWEVVIASAGCAWYIRKLLSHLGQLPPIHANPGRFVEGQGLLMSLPYGMPFFCPVNGIDKSAIVKAGINKAGQAGVAYAGDGLTDVVPSLLVNENYRFARGDLARVLDEKKQGYHSFERWREIVSHLLKAS